jgi:DNA polymerase-3 subunit gamma/tau
MGSGSIEAANVRAMLGLADRGRIFDLVERLLAGTSAQAIELFAELHRDGAEPLQILGDLAEAVHTATRAKVLGADAAGEGLSAEERRRAADLGGRLSLPLLARAWQILLKGLEEAADAPNATAAAEMVLIRLAYTADLPPPDEILKALGNGATVPGASREPAPAPAPPAGRAGPTSSGITDVRTKEAEFAARFGMELSGADDTVSAAPDPDNDTDEGSDLGGDAPAMPMVRSFLDVVDLVGARREAKLKVHLEEHVSLVKFDPAGSIELHLLTGAPKELPNELREKLNAWTGMRWMVALGNAPGERPLGVVQREREAAELSEIKSHPVVAAVLQEFPDAQVKLKPLPGMKPSDTGTQG